MWDSEKVASIATQVLVEHLGVAAQFVVEDAMTKSMAAARTGNEYEELLMYTFLINLSEMLPANLPTAQIRDAIRKKYDGK